MLEKRFCNKMSNAQMELLKNILVMDPQQRITAKVALRTPWLRDCCVSRSPRQKGLSYHGSRVGSTSCPPPAQRTHNCRAMSPGVGSGRGSPIASPCAVPEGPAQPWFRGTRPPSSQVQPVHALPPFNPDCTSHRGHHHGEPLVVLLDLSYVPHRSRHWSITLGCCP